MSADTQNTCKLGLDTGGTFTDSVLLDASGNVVASAKSPTTHHDLSIGLRGAVQGLGDKLSDYQVTLVSMSTTLATNALVEGHGRRVCLLLIGYTEAQLGRARLSEVMGRDPVVFIPGGHNAAGEAQAELDFNALQDTLAEHAEHIDAYAVSAMFGVRNPSHEIAVREWLREHTDKPVSCGFELSSGLDAPRRALTAVLNARLIPLIHQLLDSTREMLSEYGIEAPLMVVKGDGSLVSAAVAAISPVETILSGPAASVVGANFLSREPDLVISDMGGTTTDVAVLDNGVPALDPEGATVGGWTTMVRAIRIHTYGLGGDSEISYDRDTRVFRVGPQRVLPVSRCLHLVPELIPVLEKQLELPYSTTHSARFAYLPSLLGTSNSAASASQESSEAALEPAGLSGQQRELWKRIQRRPIAVQTLFEDQTLDLPLQRLVAAGHVAIAAFTPTDALLLLGRSFEGLLSANKDGASLAARLLMRYSEQNLGPVWQSIEAYANDMREQVARDSAMAILETLLLTNSSKPNHRYSQGVVTKSVAKSKPGKKRARLPHLQRQLIEQIFDGGPSDLQLHAAMKQPLIGLGAPAAGYYDRVAEYLGTSVELPELAGVANAIGAVAGSVSQSRSLTITPVGGARVQVHTESGPVEFDDLETAATEAEALLTEAVTALASNAGAESVQTTTERNDIVASNQGESVFFESTISVTAFGRPGTA